MVLNIIWSFPLTQILRNPRLSVFHLQVIIEKNYPVNIILDGKQLPWVDRVEYLGHILMQNGSMEADTSRARAAFMAKAIDIRENLYFASPEQRVQVIQLYCCDAYGSICNLYLSA